MTECFTFMSRLLRSRENELINCILRKNRLYQTDILRRTCKQGDNSFQPVSFKQVSRVFAIFGFGVIFFHSNPPP